MIPKILLKIMSVLMLIEACLDIIIGVITLVDSHYFASVSGVQRTLFLFSVLTMSVTAFLNAGLYLMSGIYGLTGRRLHCIALGTCLSLFSISSMFHDPNPFTIVVAAIPVIYTFSAVFSKKLHLRQRIAEKLKKRKIRS